jgi:drug/metabolite transporter (DMT)-like permease
VTASHNSIRQRLNNLYNQNLGLLLVFLAQTCGSVMNVAAKLLTTDYEEKLNAMQIIFVRMSCTTVFGVLYMLYHRVPDFPLGKPEIRGLLVLRGTSGFIGLFGLYCMVICLRPGRYIMLMPELDSLAWLQFSDATVITFLIPTMTALVCFVWLREPYTWKEALAGIVAFCGVLLVARPPWLFPAKQVGTVTGYSRPDTEATANILALVMAASTGKLPTTPAPLSPGHRAIVIMVAVLGAFMAATAYATIRVIGKRAHSLISVNYFAAIATIGSALILAVHPDLHFVVPRCSSQWGLMAIIGAAGFLLQFLLTEGLQRETAGRATNLTYLQLVFALIVDRVIWGTTPPVESFVGAVLIIGAAIWVSLQKNTPAAERQTAVDEENSSAHDHVSTEAENDR